MTGHDSLQDAAIAMGLEPGAIAARLEMLQRAPNEGRDWRGAGNSKLIQHILERFHQRHRQQLPELIRLARLVEDVHGTTPDCPRGLAEHLAAMQQELESHMMKEEQVLFPMLARGFASAAVTPISLMRFEHDQHGGAHPYRKQHSIRGTRKCRGAGQRLWMRFAPSLKK